MIEEEKEQNFIYYFLKHLMHINILKGNIIFENSYDDFENAKFMFIKDPFLKYHIGNITILNHTYNKNYKKLKKIKLMFI